MAKSNDEYVPWLQPVLAESTLSPTNHTGRGAGGLRGRQVKEARALEDQSASGPIGKLC